jgi:uncharacterized membrane protein
MKLDDYKLSFVAVGLIGVLLIASPAIAQVIRLPTGEQFSELYLLGPNHMAENYPFNIDIGQNYSTYVVVGDNTGSSAYYVLYVKLLNQTDLAPNASSHMASPLQPLYEYRFSVQDGQRQENPLNFSVSEGSIKDDQSLINKMIINGHLVTINKPSTWNSNSSTFLYQLFFEMWKYNNESNAIEYSNLSVHLLLNFTSSVL